MRFSEDPRGLPRLAQRILTSLGIQLKVLGVREVAKCGQKCNAIFS